jgi:cell fate (sporulation/competence/biofilm development) regulator YlbF (YheA/YmcA/DUF963 family)
MDTTNRDRTFERAVEVGRLVSQTPEFRHLKSAHQEIGDDREATARINEMRELQTKMLEQMERGEEPPEESREKLEQLGQDLQSNSRYQALISAQANFDRLMEKIQDSIGAGIRAGEESRIVIP